jgi:hypothetical protein
MVNINYCETNCAFIKVYLKYKQLHTNQNQIR